MGDQVLELINRTRRLTSALRASERGWDWAVVDSPDGPVVDVVTVSIEEASRDSRLLILQLMEIQRASQGTRSHTGTGLNTEARR